MALSPAAAQEPQTLAQHLTGGPLPLADALQYAMDLADALRRIHEDRKVHGAMTPATIAVTERGIELLPTVGASAGDTPYTAPEVRQGGAADARSDIYAFGTILYEMVAGQPPKSSDTLETVVAGVAGSALSPSGNRAMDRLLTACLAQDPEARYQRVHRLQLELKLLLAAAARSMTPASESFSLPAETNQMEKRTPVPQTQLPTAQERADGQVPQALLAEMRQMERRMTERLEAQARVAADKAHSASQVSQSMLSEMRLMEERMAQRIEAHAKAVAERERFSLDGLHSLRAELSFAIVQLTVLREQSVAAPSRLEASSERGMRRLEDAVFSIGERLGDLETAVKTSTERIEGMEQNLDSLDQAAAEVRDSVTRDLVNFERAFRSQAAAIESTRTAIGQTDDLVERIVEAVESLQGVVMERSEEPPLAAAKAS